MWKWVIYYILLSDTTDSKLLSVDTFDECWRAEIDLEFKLNGWHLVGFPGLPKDALITGFGATNNWEES